MKSIIILASIVSSSVFAQTSPETEICNSRLLDAQGMHQCVSALDALRSAGKEVTEASVSKILSDKGTPSKNYKGECLEKIMFRNDQMVSVSSDQIESCVF